MTRYCRICKVHIDFEDKETKCPVCLHETVLDTEEARVQRVRASMIKALKAKSVYADVFNEGKHTGIREVVEWLRKNSASSVENKGKLRLIQFDEWAWQDKLKEWGV